MTRQAFERTKCNRAVAYVAQPIYTGNHEVA